MGWLEGGEVGLSRLALWFVKEMKESETPAKPTSTTRRMLSALPCCPNAKLGSGNAVPIKHARVRGFVRRRDLRSKLCA